jgi:hypothetical protein
VCACVCVCVCVRARAPLSVAYFECAFVTAFAFLLLYAIVKKTSKCFFFSSSACLTNQKNV